MDKKCVLYGHLGMGDMYWMNGAVRFLATSYDEVVVICKSHNTLNTIAMYADDPTIKVFCVPNDVPISMIVDGFKDYAIIACGISAFKGAENYPDSFYTDIHLNPDIRTKFFAHAYHQESKDLADSLTVPYTVVHEAKSNTHIDLSPKLRPNTHLTLNIERNIYPKGHAYYHIAQQFVDLPLCHYIHTLQGARELHLIESALACLAVHLDLSGVAVKRVYEASPNFINLGVFTRGKI